MTSSKIKKSRIKKARPATSLMSWILLVHAMTPVSGAAYVVNTMVADMRQPASVAGNTACPQPTRDDLTIPGGVRRQWSTSLGTSPASILTADQTAAGRLNEIEATISQAYGVWTGVAGSKLLPASLAPLARASSPTSCAADGVNSICFNQSDPAFSTGVLAFTRVVTADLIGEQAAPGSPAASFPGEILDADIMVRPADATVRFATPAALAANPTVYDLESVLTHEMGHTFGAGHSDVWRAVMFPFVPPAGTFLGSRPTSGSPDAPLAEDDRAVVRALYPDPADTTHAGSIAGRVLPANESGAFRNGHDGHFCGARCRRRCRNGSGGSRRVVRVVLLRSRSAGVRRLLPDRPPARWPRRGISGLRGTARWTCGSERCIRINYAVPQCADRSGLAGTIRMRDARACHQFFDASSLRAVNEGCIPNIWDKTGNSDICKRKRKRLRSGEDRSRLGHPAFLGGSTG